MAAAVFGAALPTGPYQAGVAPASPEAELAMKRIHLPRGFQVELFAAEPRLANPVAFCVDEKGRFYVCETFRLHDGVTDIRGKNDWLDEDLACRTVDERLAMMKRHLGAGITNYSAHPDRVRLIEDRNGDGKADFDSVFASGFNHPLDGIAAGVLARHGQVWLANIPHLWSLRDTDGDGAADQRKSLHYGFGVRVGFLGHDLHGLRFGPDGKIYFSVGDRGSHVESNGRVIGDAESGSVFRCYPDGSELELFATGLRNPQELAFDQYGNLFTGDNNSDGGDRARWVYLVEGGDSGWRIGYQFIESPVPRGPWNAEKLWFPQWEGQAAYLLPPIANIADGPSGLAYYPGTGLPKEYLNHFFLCDFHGGKGSGIHTFSLAPKGAAFELVNRRNFIWECLPTDVDFGVEGGIYYTDWVQGWGKTGKGRIYRVFEPGSAGEATVRETKHLLAEGVDRKSLPELAELLGHDDMRVRLEAQFALAAKSREALIPLTDTVRHSTNQLARLHALWAFGQIGAMDKASFPRPPGISAARRIQMVLRDRDPEIRAQAAKLLGDLRAPFAYSDLIRLLDDPSPRVRFFAALGLGKLGRVEAVPPIFALLQENADQDPYLRHAGVMALTWIGQVEALLAGADHSSPAVRMGVLLALRRLQRAEIGRFLADSDPRLVEEAARAINDRPIDGALVDLARLVQNAGHSAPTLRRALNANFRLGTSAAAGDLVRFARNKQADPELRSEALQALSGWAAPSGRDRVTGLWRPIAAPRDPDAAREALAPALAELLEEETGPVRLEAIRVAGRYDFTEREPGLFAILQNQQAGEAARVEALRVLARMKSPRLSSALTLASSDSSEVLRQEAIRVRALMTPEDSWEQIVRVLESGTVAEQQTALAALATLSSPGVDEVLAEWLDRLLGGNLKPELHLDLLEAAGQRPSDILRRKLQKFAERMDPDDSLAAHRTSLRGGNAALGRKIFYEKPEAGCFRCHKISGQGGEVGPDLTGLAGRLTREQILESLILPNQSISPGYENVVVRLQNGALYAGIVKEDTEQELVLESPEDGLLKIAKKQIATRDRGLSAMPEGLSNILTSQDIRHLVEFLAGLR